MKATKQKKEGKNIEAHLSAHLLQGKTITHSQALKMWKTNRLAEYVRRLKAKGMNIKTDMVYEVEDTYGVYSLVRKPKVDRIKNRAYLNQAYPKGLTN